MKCPHCQNNVIQKSGDGHGLRFRIIEKSLRRAPDGSIRALCFWCKSEVVLPLKIADEPIERFIIPAQST